MLKIISKLLMWVVFGYWPRRKEEPKGLDPRYGPYRETHWQARMEAERKANPPPKKWWIACSECVWSVVDSEPPEDWFSTHNHMLSNAPKALGPFLSYELAKKARDEQDNYEPLSSEKKWWIVRPLDEVWSVVDYEPPTKWLDENHSVSDEPIALGPFSSYELACKARCEQNAEDYLAVKEELFVNKDDDIRESALRISTEYGVDEKWLIDYARSGNGYSLSTLEKALQRERMAKLDHLPTNYPPGTPWCELEIAERLERVAKECQIDTDRLLAHLQRRRDARRATQQTKTQSTPSPSIQENASGSADDENDSVAPASPPEL